jgi:polar amino acid transport system permease protein
MSAWQIILAEAPRFFTWWNLLFLGQALINTLIASILGCGIGYALGFLLATLRLPAVMKRKR